MNTEQMIVECNVPEGYYCTVNVLTEAHEVLIAVGGIILIFAFVIAAFVYFMHRMDR